MKKFIATLCLAALLCSSLPVAFAADEPDPEDGVEVIITPMSFKIPHKPVIKN